ncbi:hypothetical protein KR044_001320 [Drosophila immigrans]|nr:hypothetical protein KR044_001320 [Drosophila immigrans]
MFKSLMQLAAQLCEKDKEGSADQPPKEYSIYLLVNSDDEADDVPQVAQPTAPQYSSSCSQVFSQPNCQRQEIFPKPPRRKKKRALLRIRREQELLLSASRPPRRPLHWPKLDYSKLANNTGKKPKKPKKAKHSAQSMRKYQLRWN